MTATTPPRVTLQTTFRAATAMQLQVGFRVAVDITAGFAPKVTFRIALQKALRTTS